MASSVSRAESSKASKPQQSIVHSTVGTSYNQATGHPRDMSSVHKYTETSEPSMFQNHKDSLALAGRTRATDATRPAEASEMSKHSEMKSSRETTRTRRGDETSKPTTRRDEHSETSDVSMFRGHKDTFALA